jgi:uncharacterized membrane protein YjgN (DUF898 family)
MIGVQQFARSVVEGRVAVTHQWAGLVTGSMAVVGGLGVVLYIALLPLALAKVKAYQHNHYQLGNQRLRMQIKAMRFYGLALKTAAWIAVPLLLAVALFMIPTVREVFSPTGNKALALGLGMGVVVAYLAGFVVVSPFFNARLQNLVWNHSASEQLRFASHLRFRSLAWLTAKNWLLTLLTLGLYRPFALINTWQLRIEAITIDVTGSMDGWDGSDSAAYADASGEAAGDFFGIDLGL